MTQAEIKLLAKEIVKELKHQGLAMPDNDEYLNTKEASKLMGVEPSYLYKHPEIESTGYRKQKRYSKNYLLQLISNGM